ncbi:phosphatase PAP2 family protein [Marinicella meishanensis]|uniref:phosphatase PAP2 family protein n=1 Tax=Marinicella meishanensis TaxID=2873263 RepID=UPI001CBBE2EF|nr:phosphatase PAP2 family protein [Marinicella sp. NBU2979]
MKPLDLIQSIDTSLVNKLFSARMHGKLLPTCKFISAMGDGWMYLLVGLAALILNGIDHGYFWVLSMAFAIERPCYYLLKNSLKRNRPFRILNIQNQVNPSDQFSFPSGHTSAAFLFFTVTAAWLPLLWIPLLFWATTVGLSRVVLGVHYPTDIVVGALMGVGLAQLTLLMI